ncbi:MAG: peroxiredoxin [Methanomassiliicoccus sp.]|nr:peroxiredoxin [Methanomassiliicoccus sp.]
MDGTELGKERVEVPCIGKPCPHMEVQTTRGAVTLPQHFAGKWFLLFSHPGDFTPVCTTEFASFARHHDEFRKLNCELIGISVDSLQSHIAWVRWIRQKLGVEITFPVIADPFGDASRKLGAIHPATGGSAVRALIIIDPKGIVRALFYYPRGVGRSTKELLRTMRALQVADKHGVVTPANWPENEFVGDHVLLKPPRDEKGAEERDGEDGCLDWWFCHRAAEE